MKTSLAQRLKTAREGKGLSLQQAAIITGVTASRYHDLESRSDLPTQKEIHTFAELYDVTPEWLERGEIVELQNNKPRLAANESHRLILTSQGQRPPVSAPDLLRAGMCHLENRASQRDCENGERSMADCVNAFNALFHTELTEQQGWMFMVLLKASRAKAGSFIKDDYEDGAAYFALAGEAASKEAA